MKKYYNEAGRLKIFLGMAAGVGKTYSMLEAAQKKMEEGVYVLAGIVNTHGRPETAKLLEPIKQVPEKAVLYKEKVFKELDLDEIKRLKPQLILIDELAHTNIPGSKHLKRWQDVEEILEAGIDVYTTLNIQHVESYKDIIEGITGVKIRETVPDLILEKASSITCVDIPPGELLQRLREGKVYTGDFTNIALENFFQEDRLTALREISLLCTAEIVDLELHAMFKAIQKGKGWKPRERLLVAVNHNPYAQQLIRTGRRVSLSLHAPWVVLYVDEGENLSDAESAMLAKNLALARELGAEVITTQDFDVAQGIQRIAEQKRITRIVVGKSLRHHFFKKSPVNALIKITSGIDVHIIRHSLLNPKVKKKIAIPRLNKGMFSYLHILFWVALLGFLGTLFVHHVGHYFVGSFFVLSILLLSLFYRKGPVFLSAIAFAFIWHFFMYPTDSLKEAFAEDSGFTLLYFLAALVTGALSNRVRKRQEMLSKKEESINAIYDIVRDVSFARTADDLFHTVNVKLGIILQGKCEIIPQKTEGELDLDSFFSISNDSKEKAVAQWVYQNGKEAGWSTSTLSSAKNLYIPLKVVKETIGVLVFSPYKDRHLLPEESNFLYTVCQLLANYLERSFSEERERKSELFQQIEQMYAKVLQSIGDELFPPLKIIQNATFDLREERLIRENHRLLDSLQNIEKTSTSLMRIAENAVAMAKLSRKVMSFDKINASVKELIETSLQKEEAALKYHQLTVKIDPLMPNVPFDFTLMTILLHHLLTNAAQYSPQHSTIEIQAELIDGTFILSVSDEGEGIPPEMTELVFEKFYRLRGTLSTGLGLGLAIVKSIAEIHKGYIRVQNRETGGTTFSFILPL